MRRSEVGSEVKMKIVGLRSSSGRFENRGQGQGRAQEQIRVDVDVEPGNESGSTSRFPMVMEDGDRDPDHPRSSQVVPGHPSSKVQVVKSPGSSRSRKVQIVQIIQVVEESPRSSPVIQVKSSKFKIVPQARDKMMILITTACHSEVNRSVGRTEVSGKKIGMLGWGFSG
jgi:hypothetical protein